MENKIIKTKKEIEIEDNFEILRNLYPKVIELFWRE